LTATVLIRMVLATNLNRLRVQEDHPGNLASRYPGCYAESLHQSRKRRFSDSDAIAGIVGGIGIVRQPCAGKGTLFLACGKL